MRPATLAELQIPIDAQTLSETILGTFGKAFAQPFLKVFFRPFHRGTEGFFDVSAR